jgi:hypothetical protein
VDGTRFGPVMSVTTDATSEGDACTMMCFKDDITSGSRTLALYGTNRLSTLGLDTTYHRGFQVLEFTGADASLLADLNLTSSATAPGTYATINGMTTTQTPVDTNSVMLMVSNVQIAGDSGDAKAKFRQAFAGTQEGAEIINWTDDTDRASGMLMARAKTGLSGSTAFDQEWEEIGGGTIADTGRARQHQLAEFTNAAAGAPIPAMMASYRRHHNRGN